MSDMRLVVAGAGGRMGRTLIKAIAETPGLALSGALEDAKSPLLGQDSGQLVRPRQQRHRALGRRQGSDHQGRRRDRFHRAEGVGGARGADRGQGSHHRHHGHSADEEAKVKDAAKSAVIVKSGNMSLGVNLLAALTKRVAKTLGEEFDIEIFEMHHNKKIDAPSGTALMFGRAAAEGRGIDLGERSHRGRDGETGARTIGNIGFASLRGGSVVGEHSVIFAGPAERVELIHRAEDRMIFARGALKAALWARGQKPGLYSMIDVLGLGDM